jgi:hypothetical protein
MGGIGGKPGWINIEYETGSLAGITMTVTVGAAGTGGAAGAVGARGGTGGGQPGNGGTSSAGADSGAGLNYLYITNPKTLQRKEVFNVN